MYYRFYDRYRNYNDRLRRRFPFRIYYEDYRSTVLTVDALDPLIVENGSAHRTSKYEIMNRVGKEALLVVRRGQEFYINLTLSRNYDPINDGISLVFKLDGASHTTSGQRTLVAIPVLGRNETSSDTTWQATVAESHENEIKIKIKTSPDAIIGKWKIEIDTRNKDSGGAISSNVNEPFYLLFNPWCTEDAVYLPLEKERAEYVLMDSGLIWRGTHNSMSSTAWKYAQFDENILECALYLMQNVGGVRPASRNDPVIVTRCLSAAINANDDNGVVTGNWSEDFKDGTEPTKWLGSRKILQEYFKTKRSVKYGQCWVFAGVLATICRTLGIPCRVVTNYLSAHDTENSLTVDYFVDEEGKIMKELASDSVWNYHVWNEVWMKRLDLGTKYSGWQAIDATPQELSSDVYRCGPASVYAVKNGEILKPCDTAFLFAEVNADTVYWRYNGPSQPVKLVSRNINSIGQFISTKAVGKWEREDITDNYKHPEKTTEERDIMLKALRQSESSFSRYYLNEDFNDVKFNFDLHDDIIIGQPFRVRMKVENISSDEDYRVNLILRVDVVSHRGIVGRDVKKIKIDDMLMKPNQDETIDLPVTWEEYSPHLQNDTNFQISCLATIDETNYEYYAQDDVAVKKPDIIVRILSDPKVGYELQASAEFSNPLPISLKKGKFIIDGPGLAEQLKLVLSDPVRPGQLAKCSFSMMPNHSGKATIVVKFYSKELSDVDGFKEFMVKSVNSYYRNNY
ncbi:annulin-like isoform X2 [Leptopilina heterotoma]|uniref:annulin-like isoform X2 n=1 Tax=Leptopilina heterotoma TaxID=63436 RepID=UPI001CA9D4B3|nr:annulin-like isoform X2 [Leptopilina heterotoma]